MTFSRTEIHRQSAVAIRVAKDQVFRVVNSEGQQVVDTWMFNASNSGIFLSMAHSRTATYRLFFQPGDTLVDNCFNPMVTFLNDTSPGLHDTLHAACSPGSYSFFGESSNHPNCSDNLRFALQEQNIVISVIPDPWNLFEQTIVDASGQLADQPSPAQKDDYVELCALQDLLLVCSACPSTVGMISGKLTRGAAIDLKE